MRHNEIRALTATFLREVAPCVEMEPNLQPITGEVFDRRSANVEENIRLDVKCKRFCNAIQDAFFDKRLASMIAKKHNQYYARIIN